jgi:hypothetical protein
MWVLASWTRKKGHHILQVFVGHREVPKACDNAIKEGINIELMSIMVFSWYTGVKRGFKGAQREAVEEAGHHSVRLWHHPHTFVRIVQIQRAATLFRLHMSWALLKPSEMYFQKKHTWDVLQNHKNGVYFQKHKWDTSCVWGSHIHMKQAAKEICQADTILTLYAGKLARKFDGSLIRFSARVGKEDLVCKGQFHQPLGQSYLHITFIISTVFIVSAILLPCIYL